MNTKKEIIQKIITFILVLLFAFAVSATLEKVFAQSNIPEGIEVFHVEDMTFVRDTDLGKLVYWCTDSCGICEEIIIQPVPKITPTDIPPVDPTSTPVPEQTPVPPEVYCHCEQGEGEGAEGRKNCHPVQYNPGHAKHEWDYWSTDGTCTGWNH